MKILIGTPAYNNQIDGRMAKSLMRVDINMQKEGVASLEWDIPASSLLSYSRNLIVYHALRDNYDWLLFWDADIEINDPLFLRGMLETAHKYSANIVGLPCKLKGYKAYNCAMKTSEGYINFIKMGDEPQPVHVVGTGVMLIKMELFKKMVAPYFTFIDTLSDFNEPGIFPEDWNFCEKAETTIYADPRFETIHWGQYGYK